jgi:hypothetical protein
VSAGAILGVVGSSGCSTAPHLHFEVRDAANRVVDPFRNGMWAAPPLYNTGITVMDLVIAAGDMTLQQIKDPAPNVQSIPRGTVLGVGVSWGGCTAYGFSRVHGGRVAGFFTIRVAATGLPPQRQRPASRDIS